MLPLFTLVSPVISYATASTASTTAGSIMTSIATAASTFIIASYDKTIPILKIAYSKAVPMLKVAYSKAATMLGSIKVTGAATAKSAPILATAGMGASYNIFGIPILLTTNLIIIGIGVAILLMLIAQLLLTKKPKIVFNQATVAA